MDDDDTHDALDKKQKKKISRANKRRIQQQIQEDYLNVYFAKKLQQEEDDDAAARSGDHVFTAPKNPHQRQYIDLLEDPCRKIIVVSGPAGTGKTLFATEYGIKNFISKQCDTLIFTRPSVSVDENLGFLPGNIEEKMAPWIRPIYDILYQHFSSSEIEEYIAEKTIEIAPLGFMRGRTFKNAWIIADEMQNSTVGQMKMLLTRLGENSRLVVTGDLEQHDKHGELNGLDDFLTKFRRGGNRSASISSIEFETDDVQREPVVKEVLELYSATFIPEYKEYKE